MLYGSVSFEQSPAGFSLVEVFQGETRLATGYTDSDGFFELRIETGQ